MVGSGVAPLRGSDQRADPAVPLVMPVAGSLSVGRRGSGPCRSLVTGRVRRDGFPSPPRRHHRCRIVFPIAGTSGCGQLHRSDGYGCGAGRDGDAVDHDCRPDQAGRAGELPVVRRRIRSVPGRHPFSSGQRAFLAAPALAPRIGYLVPWLLEDVPKPPVLHFVKSSL